MVMDAGEGEFERWYRAEHPRLVSSLVVLANAPEDARDVADEALARALLHWSRVSAMDAPGAWVYRVAVNLLHRRARRATLERRLLARTTRPATVEGPSGETWDAVRRLPARQRVAVALRYVADLTEAEVGVAMGISRSTVSATLIAARRNLAAQLRDPVEPQEVIHG